MPGRPCDPTYECHLTNGMLLSVQACTHHTGQTALGARCRLERPRCLQIAGSRVPMCGREPSCPTCRPYIAARAPSGHPASLAEGSSSPGMRDYDGGFVTRCSNRCARTLPCLTLLCRVRVQCIRDLVCLPSCSVVSHAWMSGASVPTLCTGTSHGPWHTLQKHHPLAIHLCNPGCTCIAASAAEAAARRCYDWSARLSSATAHSADNMPKPVCRSQPSQLHQAGGCSLGRPELMRGADPEGHVSPQVIDGVLASLKRGGADAYRLGTRTLPRSLLALRQYTYLHVHRFINGLPLFRGRLQAAICHPHHAGTPGSRLDFGLHVPPLTDRSHAETEGLTSLAVAQARGVRWMSQRPALLHVDHSFASGPINAWLGDTTRTQQPAQSGSVCTSTFALRHHSVQSPQGQHVDKSHAHLHVLGPQHCPRRMELRSVFLHVLAPRPPQSQRGLCTVFPKQIAGPQVTTPVNQVKALPHLCLQRRMPLPGTPLGGERVSRVEWASKVEPDGISHRLTELGDSKANAETQHVVVAATGSGWVSTPGASTEDELSDTDSEFGDPKVDLPPPPKRRLASWLTVYTTRALKELQLAGNLHVGRAYPTTALHPLPAPSLAPRLETGTGEGAPLPRRSLSSWLTVYTSQALQELQLKGNLLQARARPTVALHPLPVPSVVSRLAGKPKRKAAAKMLVGSGLRCRRCFSRRSNCVCKIALPWLHTTSALQPAYAHLRPGLQQWLYLNQQCQLGPQSLLNVQRPAWSHARPGGSVITGEHSTLPPTE